MATLNFHMQGKYIIEYYVWGCKSRRGYWHFILCLYGNVHCVLFSVVIIHFMPWLLLRMIFFPWGRCQKCMDPGCKWTSYASVPTLSTSSPLATCTDPCPLSWTKLPLWYASLHCALTTCFMALLLQCAIEYKWVISIHRGPFLGSPADTEFQVLESMNFAL